MIQRIQTVFFFLASLFSAIGFFLPLFTIASTGTGQTQTVTLMDTDIVGLPVVIVSALAVLMPFILIFLYKNRPIQIRLGRVAILVNTMALALLAMAYGSLPQELKLANAQITPAVGMFLPVASIVFIILAVRGVKKDEALVRSADRIR